MKNRNGRDEASSQLLPPQLLFLPTVWNFRLGFGWVARRLAYCFCTFFLRIRFFSQQLSVVVFVILFYSCTARRLDDETIS